MRQLATAERIERFLEQLGRELRQPCRLYLVGGATAVLHGFRATTIDIDLHLVPDRDEALRAIQRLKEELQVNVELAAPDQFVPELPGWQERSPFVGQYGALAVYHYDPYAQALAKLERGHNQDVADVEGMVEAGLVRPASLAELFEGVADRLFRYPAIDPETFRRSVMTLVGRYAE